MFPLDFHVQFALDRSRRFERLATEHRAIALSDAESAIYGLSRLRRSASRPSRSPTIRDPASPAAA
jgi:hypothetical protein